MRTDTSAPLKIDHGAPYAILADPVTPDDEKRALLASWASDYRAVENAPALRRLEDGTLLHIDDVPDGSEAARRGRARTPSP